MTEIPEIGEKAGGVRRFVAFLGIFFILTSQFLIFSSPIYESVLLPPYTWLAILGVVILASSQLIRPTPFLEWVSNWFVFRERTFWVFASFSFSLLATGAVVSFMLSGQLNYIPVVTVWLLSAGAYTYAFWYAPINMGQWLEWIKKNRRELLMVAGITLLAAVFRFYRLGGIPRILDGDEGLIGIYAQDTVSGPLANPFALWENFGGIYLQLINLSIRFFGVNAFALRLLPAIGGVLAIPSLYLFSRRVVGQRMALIAIMILAFSHSHIHYSRIVSIAYIHGTWLAPLELYLLMSGLEKRESWRTALSGILIAIHFSVYITAQFIISLSLVFMLIAFLFYRPWLKARWNQALVFWGGFLITIMPSAFYIYTTPHEFFNRFGQDGTVQSGWLAETVRSTGQSTIEVLFGRFVHAFLSLIYYPAVDFYGSSSPTMSMIASTLFLVGLAIALWRIRNPNYLLLNGYFWGATFSVGIFAIPPSADTYRMLMAFPAALVMAAIGLDTILDLLGLGYESKPTAYKSAAAAVLTSLLIFNLWTYYGDFAGQCRYGGDTVSRFASYLGGYAQKVESEQSIYLLSNNQYFYGSHGSTDFLSSKRKIINFPESIDALDVVSGETIIANPDRILELEIWAHDNPGGELQYQYDCKNTILLAYRIP